MTPEDLAFPGIGDTDYVAAECRILVIFHERRLGCRRNGDPLIARKQPFTKIAGNFCLNGARHERGRQKQGNREILHSIIRM